MSNMKKIFLLLFSFSLTAFSQTTIFTETMGSVSATTTIAAHETNNGFDNKSFTMTDGGAANPADIRATSSSTGYAGASGGANVWFTSTAGDRGFAIEGIDASSYANMKLNFAVRKEGGAGTDFATFAVQYWDGAAFNTVNVNSFPTSSSAAGWYLISTVSLPPAAQINGLKIRFLKTGTIACRLDDVKLFSDSTGGGDDDTSSVPKTNISTTALSLSFGQIASVPSQSQNFSVSGINLTDSIIITSPANFEISLNNSVWNKNSISLPQNNGVVSSTPLYVRYNPAAIGSHSGNISFTSTGVATQNVSASGTYTTVVPPSSDYYSGAYRLFGTALRAALHNIIKGHSVISYDGLYTAFPSTDTKPNGKVWDIYSDVPGGTSAYEYTHGTKKCGSYGGEGDCYNREHSWPDSWLGATNPARSDLFHIYPTDGFVNNRRSNYPFGTVASASWTSTNGSKLGNCSYPGYTGIVFEPINEYKGDLARSAMYMSARYYTADGGWIATPATNKSDLLPWYANLLYDWSVQDTVSVKEINRNNAIYTYQKNRNPFIDRPEFAAEIWKTDMPPRVVLVKQLSSTALLIDFSRYLDSTAAATKTNFQLDNSIGNASGIQWGVNNDISKIIVTVPALANGTNYLLTIKNLKSINNVAMSDTIVTFKTSGTVAVPLQNQSLPRQFALEQNYPNPFNPTTTISYSIPAAQNLSGFENLTSLYVSLKIYDALGREVATVVNEFREAGRYTQQFDASRLSSGVYYYTLRAGKFSATKHFTMLK